MKCLLYGYWTLTRHSAKLAPLMQVIATCAWGLEMVLTQEIEALGFIVHKEESPPRGQVRFETDLKGLYRANLWLRSASRVLVPLRRFSAKTPEMIYDQTRRIPWENYLNTDLTFAILPTGTGDDKRALLSRSLKVKDALVDRLRREQGGVRPNVDRKNPDVEIVAHFQEGFCELSLNASGDSLHLRGYRSVETDAPLKETLAAAILLILGVSHKNLPTVICDPFCGAGSFLTEAILIASNTPPGIFRKEFGFSRWLDFDSKMFEEVKQEAMAAQVALPSNFRLTASDQSERSVGITKKLVLSLLKQLQLKCILDFEIKSFNEIRAYTQSGLLVANPPYGERMGDESEIAELYKNFGDMLKKEFSGWRAGVLTGNLAAAKSFGLRPSKKIKLYNGPIECRLLEFHLFSGALRDNRFEKKPKQDSLE